MSETQATEVKKEVSFVMAVRDFFGYQPGQGMQAFNAELKALTDKDRADLTAMFEEMGWTIKIPAPAVK